MERFASSYSRGCHNMAFMRGRSLEGMDFAQVSGSPGF